LDLTKFQSPPKPIVKPIIVPKKPIIKKVVKKRKIKKEKVIKRKKIVQKKKILVAKEVTEDNNTTKNSIKSAQEKMKKKIAKLKERKRQNRIKKAKEAKRVKRVKELKREKKLEATRKRLAELKKREDKLKKRELKYQRERARIKHQRVSKTYNSALANTLMNGGQAKSYKNMNTRTLNANSSSRLINQLYGKEFNSYSSQEKQFLKRNLSLIHRLTQRALSRNGYPESAIRMGEEGVNIVSFYLHPNGNITQLKLDKSMGHSSLDNNTLRVIRIAYSNYPLPSVKTKIKFYVNYTIN